MDVPVLDIVYHIDFDEDNAEDVTEAIKNRCENKWKDSIEKVLKYKGLYKVYFCLGYTAFCEKVRYARRMSEAIWYAKIATEEKKYGYTLDYYIKDFTKNHIYFDGKSVPIFIDTIEDVQKRLNNK